MVSKQKILIVDDDENIAELISLYLTKECFETMIVGDGESALSAVNTFEPNLILLDLMLPGIDGYQVCREVRAKNQVPIIILSAKGEVFDKVTLLEMGADDYITKPFEMREVIARVRAVLRRFEKEEESKKLIFDNLIIDKRSYNITVKGQKMEIPPKEIELLYFLASSPNRVFTRAQLLDDVWGFDYFGDTRTVDVHVKRLREKLQGVSDQWEIKTVWGVGYKFELAEGATMEVG